MEDRYYMPSLGVAMIVKNEAQFIEKVIQNIQPIADEIVITDTGSTDSTIDIVKKFKLKLFHYKWDGDESRARNFTLSKCNTEWIICIDADEFIDIRDYQKIRKLISSKNRYIAYRIFLRHYLDPRINLEDIFQKTSTNFYTLNTMVRLFKNNEKIFYSGSVYSTVHESLRGRIDKIGDSKVTFHHLDILRNAQKRIEKRRWYLHDVFENLKRFPSDPDINYIVAHYYWLRGNFNKAIRYYKKTLQLNPKHIKAKLSLGLSYVAIGKEDRGMKTINACRNNKGIYSWELESYLNTAYKIIIDRTIKEKRRTE